MPGPPSPGTAKVLAGQVHPQKISGTGESYGPPAPGSDAAKRQLVTDEVTATWRTFATALGQSAPHGLGRIQRASSALRRYGG